MLHKMLQADINTVNGPKVKNCPLIFPFCLGTTSVLHISTADWEGIGVAETSLWNCNGL